MRASAISLIYRSKARKPGGGNAPLPPPSAVPSAVPSAAAAANSAQPMPSEEADQAPPPPAQSAEAPPPAAKDGDEESPYLVNLIDSPGHIDFCRYLIQMEGRHWRSAFWFDMYGRRVLAWCGSGNTIQLI